LGGVEFAMRGRSVPSQWIEVGHEVPSHAEHVDEGVHLDRLLVARRRLGERAAIWHPPRRLVRHAEAREHVVVEAVVDDE
jgi:hypothetical protein